VKSLTLPILILLTTHAYSQDMKVVEGILSKKFQQIAYWRDYPKDDTTVDFYDSLGKANINFQNALLKIASTYLASLRYDFTLLQDSGLTIATSDDHRFRIYSWDSELGGSAHNFFTIFQFEGAKGVQAKVTDTTANIDESGFGGFYTPIYTLHTPVKTYYLVISHYILSHKDETQGVDTYCINNGSLDGSVRIFKTKTGLHNGISFDFNFFSVVNRPERPIQLIDFDSVHRSIRIPVVLEDGTVTNRTIVYRWTGQYFERK
jgi:hypothetical protein